VNGTNEEMEGCKDSGPNIILITTDQQRYDTLGINGNPRMVIPHLGALARSGVHFANAYSQNTVCVPSRACIQTGRYTHQHGVTYMEDVVDDTPGLPDWELTFMEHLQAHGYHTGATGKIHMCPEKGFDWHRLTAGEQEFYDRVNDPREQNNLAQSGGHIPNMDELEGVLLDWLAQTEWRHNYPNS